MTKMDADYRRDLIQELDDVAAFTVEGREAFDTDIKTQKAVIRSCEVVGEISKRLAIELREANPQIDWRKLITFRDIIAHNYDVIDLRLVWAAVEDVPALRAAVKAILDGLDDEPDDEEG